jgi:UDP-glucuronate 4-epimerase
MAYFKFAKAITDGRPIDVYNNGALKRDFTYVDDIVNGVLSAIDHASGYEIINLGNSHPVELGRFIEILEKELGMTARKNMMPMQPGDVLATYADTTKAKRMLGWQSTTSIEEGLKKFILWFKEYYHV